MYSGVPQRRCLTEAADARNGRFVLTLTYLAP
jgi:hypothetical protein